MLKILIKKKRKKKNKVIKIRQKKTNVRMKEMTT